MRKLASLAAMILPLCLPQASWAQAPSANAYRIAEARQANANLMRQFGWESRTQISVNGEVKDTRVDAMGYGPDGQLQRNNLSDQTARVRGLFLRHLIASVDKQQLEQYLTGLRGLLEQYTLPGAGGVQEFLNRSVATGPDAQGLFQVTGRGILQPGDVFTLWFNPLTRKPTHIEVSTTFQGEPVNLSASFRTIDPSGLNYVEFANVNAPAKQVNVQVSNYNYFRKF
jgi:hypothetical protein